MQCHVAGTPSEKIWTGYSKLPVVQKVALPDVPAANLRTKFPAQVILRLLSDVSGHF